MMDTLELTLGDDGIVGLVNDEEVLEDLAALQQRAPDAPAEDLARVASALGEPGYDVILDPAKYEALTMARFEKEDPAMPWQPTVMRIRDFGLPDFSAIERPRLDGQTLVYFARDTHTGLPYRVTLPIGSVGDASFEPMALTPVPGDPVPVPESIRESALGPRAGDGDDLKTAVDDEDEEG